MSTNVTWLDGNTYSIPASGEINWAALSNFLIALGQGAARQVQQIHAVRKATSSPVTVSGTTDCIVVTKLAVAGAVTVNLPAGTAGQIFYIVDGTGDAATNNITINRAGSDTINGATTLVLDHNSQGAVLAYNAGDTDWKIIDKTLPPGQIVNADVKAGAAIAYSKLALTGSVVNADIGSSAAIVGSKIQSVGQSNAGVVSGAGQLLGTNTNDSASTGNVGEVLRQGVAPGTTSLSTGTAANVLGTITLTAGDWDVRGAINFTPGATTSVTEMVAAISATSNTLPDENNRPANPSGGEIGIYVDVAANVLGSYYTISIPTYQTKVANGATLVLYLVAKANFSISTMSVGGYFEARRMR